MGFLEPPSRPQEWQASPGAHVGPDHGPDLGAQDLEVAGDLLADLLLEAICGLGRRPVDHENPAEGLEPMVLGGHVHDAVQRCEIRGRIVHDTPPDPV